jgi:tetratricopeptide (TPR) repeat protein
MVISVALENLAMKRAVVIVTIVACGLLAYKAISNFTIGALVDERIGLSRGASKASFIIAPLTDERVGISQEALTFAANYYSNSPRLEARLAEAHMAGDDQDPAAAEPHALRAISLSPHSYMFRLLLATIEEAKGDGQVAEESLRQALALAPNNIEVHRRLANLLLMKGKLDESLKEYHWVSAASSPLLIEALDLVWTASGESLDAVEAVTGTEPKARIKLARFLLDNSQVTEAARVFSSIDRNDRLNSPDSPAFLNLLMVAGHIKLARNLWIDLMSDNGAQGLSSTLIWNGSFETEVQKNFFQFDWTSKESDYARVSIDTRTSHTGKRSLRIDLLGRDTTKLDGEIRQMVTVNPGARYRLECYVKTERFITSEGPQIAVTDTSGNLLAAGVPIAGGSNDWNRTVVEFIAPANSPPSTVAVYVSLRRIPKYSYDEPSRGTIWLDDFEMKQQQ